MIYTPLTIKAMQIAYRAHEGQCDQTGVPYIFHPYHVAEQMDNEKRTCMALLHDVVEDTTVTYKKLEEDFPPEIIAGLKLLTHRGGKTYWEYLDRLIKDSDALIVKIGDLLHNTDRTRNCMADVDEYQINHWNEKYIKAVRIVYEAAQKMADKEELKIEYELAMKLLAQFNEPFKCF